MVKKSDLKATSGGLMTLPEAAAYLQISMRSAYGWTKVLKLPGFKVGPAWRFDLADMDKWVKAKKMKAK